MMGATSIPTALRMARRERKSTGREPFTFASPAALYEAAGGDRHLYLHAMREAGFIEFDGEAEDPCGICGWSPSASGEPS